MLQRIFFANVMFVFWDAEDVVPYNIYILKTNLVGICNQGANKAEVTHIKVINLFDRKQKAVECSTAF